jgi:hypothetical protein
MVKATETKKVQEIPEKGTPCACGCGGKTSSTSFYARTSDGYVLSRTCLEKYENSRGTMYAAPNLAT